MSEEWRPKTTVALGHIPRKSAVDESIYENSRTKKIGKEKQSCT
jgi:hypothetical protein